jgi:hypothetical protein
MAENEMRWDSTMPLPDQVNATIRRSLQDLLDHELGPAAPALFDVMSPMLRRAFECGVNLGVSLSAKASGEGVDALRKGLIEELGFVVPARPTAVKTARRMKTTRASRTSTGGDKERAQSGAVGQALEIVLAEHPGIRIVDAQGFVASLDPTIAATSVTNELRRKKGTRYRQDGMRWFLIGDPGQAAGLARYQPVPVALVGEPGAGTPASGSPADRAA